MKILAKPETPLSSSSGRKDNIPSGKLTRKANIKSVAFLWCLMLWLPIIPCTAANPTLDEIVAGVQNDLARPPAAIHKNAMFVTSNGNVLDGYFGPNNQDGHWTDVFEKESDRVFLSDAKETVNGHRMDNQYIIRRRNIVWNPDFRALGAFEMNLPEGTVFREDMGNGNYKKYIWSQGKMVPEKKN